MALFYNIFSNFSTPNGNFFQKGGVFLKVTGIICEYNPFHLGHHKQLCCLKQENTAVVCLMSGNFVQRGHPAIFDKMLRAEAAVRCGADLVLELPITAALSSAEGFAAMGVQILSPFCDQLCFGAETADPDQLERIAAALLSDEFKNALRVELDIGLSFPAARQKALAAMGFDAKLLEKPNNILAVEYCKAIISQKASMKPLPILRGGDYHAQSANLQDPSATAVRKLICENAPWKSYIPSDANTCFDQATVHDRAFGEAAILGRLRTMTDAQFEALPFGSEGLWRKLMHAARKQASLEDILTETKSKRYTRTRLDRMVMCAFLGITESDLAQAIPYTRILAFNDTGREILKYAKTFFPLVNAGEVRSEPYQQLEDRCGDLYGLFAKAPEAPGRTKNERVFYLNEG